MHLYADLDKRWIYGCYGNECNSGWYNWGRWVLLGVAIVVFIVALLSMRSYSGRRVREGKAPIAGTGWMVPPSYYQSQQQYGYQGQNPDAATAANMPPYNSNVPPYNPNVTAQDAGYYDRNGNFIQYHGNPDDHISQAQPPPGPPPGPGGPYEMSNFESDRKVPYEELSSPEPAHFSGQASGSGTTIDTSRYAPPSGPPPGHHG